MGIRSMGAPIMPSSWRRTGKPSSSSGTSPSSLTSSALKCPFLRAFMELPAAPVGKCPFLRAFAGLRATFSHNPQGFPSPQPGVISANTGIDNQVHTDIDNQANRHTEYNANAHMPGSGGSAHGSDDGSLPLLPVLPDGESLLTIHGLASDSAPLDPCLPAVEVESAPRDPADTDPSAIPMHNSALLVLGLSVHTASIDVRERLSIPEADWASSIDQLCKLPHIAEAGILSTCNRMEVYIVALSSQRGIQEVLQWMSQLSGIAQHELREHLFVLQDEDATQHLFRVASGLDSLVLGEGQILAQVKQVLKVGQSSEGFGKILTGLFKQAVSAGKRIRSQTSISTGAVSVSSAAVELADSKRRGSSLSTANLLIVGAGSMAKLLVKHLISKGCTNIVIVNRTEKRVQELQVLFPQVTLSYKPLCELIMCVGEADVIFTCTASEATLLCKSAVEALPQVASHIAHVKHFVDISVPRNVSKCVAELATCTVHNVDDLERVVAANKEERSRKAMEAQAVIEEEIKSFNAWRSSLKTLPTIKKLRAYAEKVRAGEIQKCLGKVKHNSLTPKDKQLIEEMSRAIVNKLLDGPMASLRCDGKDSKTWAETLENMHALERIFELHADAALDGASKY